MASGHTQWCVSADTTTTLSTSAGRPKLSCPADAILQHDIVVDYITTQAYASTALALSKPRGSAGATPTGSGLRRGNARLGNGGGASATSTDTSTPTGLGNGSGSRARAGNGTGDATSSNAGGRSLDGMDVDMDIGFGREGRDGDVDMAGDEPAGIKARNKGKGKEGEPRIIDEEALQSIETRRGKPVRDRKTDLC